VRVTLTTAPYRKYRVIDLSASQYRIFKDFDRYADALDEAIERRRLCLAKAQSISLGLRKLAISIYNDHGTRLWSAS